MYDKTWDSILIVNNSRFHCCCFFITEANGIRICENWLSYKYCSVFLFCHVTCTLHKGTSFTRAPKMNDFASLVLYSTVALVPANVQCISTFWEKQYIIPTEIGLNFLLVQTMGLAEIVFDKTLFGICCSWFVISQIKKRNIFQMRKIINLQNFSWSLKKDV